MLQLYSKQARLQAYLSIQIFQLLNQIYQSQVPIKLGLSKQFMSSKRIVRGALTYIVIILISTQITQVCNSRNLVYVNAQQQPFEQNQNQQFGQDSHGEFQEQIDQNFEEEQNNFNDQDNYLQNQIQANSTNQYDTAQTEFNQTNEQQQQGKNTIQFSDYDQTPQQIQDYETAQQEVPMNTNKNNQKQDQNNYSQIAIQSPQEQKEHIKEQEQTQQNQQQLEQQKAKKQKQANNIQYDSQNQEQDQDPQEEDQVPKKEDQVPKKANKKDKTKVQKISYDRFIQQYRDYDYRWKDPQVMFYRSIVYKKNLRRIKLHNANQASTYKRGVTGFAAMTQQEFQQYKFDLDQLENLVNTPKSQEQVYDEILSNENFNIDWECYDSDRNNQGKCASNYAFAVLSTIEITMRIHKSVILPFSAQQIIECAQNQQSKTQLGCELGYVQSVYQYVQNNGVGPSSQYRYNYDTYKYGNVGQCNSSLISSRQYLSRKTFIQSYGRVPSGNCGQLIFKLRFRALTVSIDSSELRDYKQGVYDINKQRQNLQLDHTVVLVGYNPEKRQYKIKNSWGHRWGLNGYAWVKESVGVCQKAYYPNLFKEKQIPKTC